MNINSTLITLAPPLPPEEMPQAMTFFVTGPQKRLINRALREIRKRTAGDDPNARLTRGDLLTILINQKVCETKTAITQERLIPNP